MEICLMTSGESFSIETIVISMFSVEYVRKIFVHYITDMLPQRETTKVTNINLFVLSLTIWVKHR